MQSNTFANLDLSLINTCAIVWMP